MYPETTKPADPSPRRRAHAATISDADMRKYGRHLLTPLSEVTALEGRMKGPDMSRTARERLTPALKALLQAPAGWRHQVRVRQRFVPELAVLRTHFPQCAAVIDHVEAMAHLACRGDRVVRLPPLLLVGPPGVGKTYFAQRLAATLHLPYEEVHMESATAAWILSGMDSTWNESKPGRIFETLVHGRFANPLILLDEIDKVGSGNRYDPMGSLYGLLEPHTASRFPLPR